MTERAFEHELRARTLGPHSSESLKRFEQALAEWVIPFLRAWSTEGDQPQPSQERQASIREALKGAPPAPEGYEWLPQLCNRLSESMRFNRRNFVNIHPSPHIPSLAASLLVSAQNPNNIVPDVSHVTTCLERECIAWLGENIANFRSPPPWGSVVGGGTIGNMTALLVARDYTYRKLSRPKPAEVRTRGLSHLPQGVILASAGSHYSIKKAAWVLGLGDENVLTIPVAYDDTVALRAKRDATFLKGITRGEWQQQICDWSKQDEARGIRELERFYNGEQRPFSLQPLDSEVLKALYGCFEYGTPLLAYVITLGTTDTGTIERPNAFALECMLKEDVYIHADAAAGGFAMLHDTVRKRAEGLDRVHSIVVDGHKLGQLAYPNGAVIFKDRGLMYEILHDAPYLRHLAPTLEGSRPGSHVAALSALIDDLGKTGRMTEWIDRLLGFTDALVEAFAQSGDFQVLHEVDLTTVAVAPIPKGHETRRDVNRLVDHVHEDCKRDTTDGACLVNRDDSLSGVKVRNVPGVSPLGEGDVDLVDIRCLRIVATNPAVTPGDAIYLVEYLTRLLRDARKAV